MSNNVWRCASCGDITEKDGKRYECYCETHCWECDSPLGECNCYSEDAGEYTTGECYEMDGLT